MQGVGFRNFVATRARAMGIDGEVWNRADGAVEVFAGSDQASLLDDLATVMWNGPGEVESVELEDVVGEVGEKGFSVGPTRR